MKVSLRLTAVAVVLSSILSGSAARAEDPKPKPKEQVWEGTMKVRPGLELRLVVHVSEQNGAEPSATLDSPDQGASGLKISSIKIDQSRLVFELEDLGAKFDGKLNDAKTEAAGTWTQGGGTTPLTLVKKDKATPEPKIVGKEQIWEGKLALNAGIALRFVLHVAKTKDGGTVAKLDSPDEGLKGLKLSSVILDKSQLSFDLKMSAARYEGKLNADGTEAAGHFLQGGAKLPLSFKKTDKITEVRRPQTPKPPFPYTVKELTYRNDAVGTTLAGTLTAPNGAGPFPAVILISGSGAQDRDETIFQHKPFLVLADALTRRGVAVLRVDDRGVGGSTGSVSKSTSEDFAGDVLAGIALLKSRPEIDARKIGLIGHSEGGLIAPLVAARSSDVAFIVLMAGTGLPGDEILLLQGQLIAKVMGAGPKALEKQRNLQTSLFKIMKTETDPKKAAAGLRQALKSALTEAEQKQAGDLDKTIDGELKKIESPWFRFFLTFDPRPTLAKVHCPVLALNGEKDLQVPPKENLAEIEKALKQAGNTHVTTKELSGLNHLFQTCKTGSVAEYGVIEETIAPSALKAIGDWVEEQVGSRAGVSSK